MYKVFRVLLGAKQIVAIDRIPERLTLAEAGGAVTVNFAEESLTERIDALLGAFPVRKLVKAVPRSQWSPRDGNGAWHGRR
jgi:threonine dehydrogenase-like Zn-dependent dehydrogenase